MLVRCEVGLWRNCRLVHCRFSPQSEGHVQGINSDGLEPRVSTVEEWRRMIVDREYSKGPDSGGSVSFFTSWVSSYWRAVCCF